MRSQLQTSSQSDSRPLTESRERELMARVVRGEELAFRELATAVRPLILSIVSRTIGNSSDLDDVCQTVLLSLWNGASRWQPTKGRISTWVASIARNRAIDHVRKQSRAAKMRERFTTESDVLAPVSFRPTGDDELLRKEARQLARCALRELAPEQRQVLELAYLEGLTQVEVAERAGLPLGTAKARIRRGMISLRRQLPRRLAA